MYLRTRSRMFRLIPQAGGRRLSPCRNPTPGPRCRKVRFMEATWGPCLHLAHPGAPQESGMTIPKEDLDSEEPKNGNV